MTILPILGAPPCWAVPENTEISRCGRTYPVGDSEFADFTAHVVERYGPEGAFWKAHPTLDGGLAPKYFEVWNEPYFMSSPKGELNAARYADLYKAAVIAGRKANPATRYLVESTREVSNSKETGLVDWAASMIEHEPSIGSYIDGIAIHPYPGNRDPFYEPEFGVDPSLGNTRLIYEDWTSRGINKPIWITEVGYSSCADKASRCVPGDTQAAREELKGQWLSDLFDAISARYGFVHAVYLYNLREWTPQSEPTENHEEWYGILDDEKGHLPAWTSFAAAVEKYDGTPEPSSEITSHVFSEAGKNVSFGFTADDSTATYECRLDAGSWSACISPKAYSGLTVTGHTFEVRAKGTEAVEATPATYSW